MNPFKAAPRCVQWASVLLIALPIFDLLVALGSTSTSAVLAQWSARLLPTATLWAVAIGLLWGINVVRIIFALLMLQALFTQFIITASYGPLFSNWTYNATWVAVPMVSLILCFLPGANRYFKRQTGEAAGRPPAAAGTAKSHSVAIGTILILALGLGIMAVGYYKWVVPRAREQSRRMEQEHERINRGGQEIQVFSNLRLLATAANQFYLDYSTSTALYIDLVGNDKFVSNLSAVAGERYPDTFTRGEEIAAVMPDGVHLSLDPETGRTRRYR
jgi:hypothetical protein